MNLTTEMARFAEVIETYVPMIEELKSILGVKQDKKLLDAVRELKAKHQDIRLHRIKAFGALVGVGHQGYAEKLFDKVHSTPESLNSGEAHGKRYVRRGLAIAIADLMVEIEHMDDPKERLEAVNDFIEWKENLASLHEFQARATMWINDYVDECEELEEQREFEEWKAKATAEEAERRANPNYTGFD